MDQRSGDGRFGGRLKIIALNSGFFAFLPNFEVLDARITVCSEQVHPELLLSRERSVWRNRKLRKKIGSFAEDRSLA